MQAKVIKQQGTKQVSQVVPLHYHDHLENFVPLGVDLVPHRKILPIKSVKKITVTGASKGGGSGLEVGSVPKVVRERLPRIEGA